MKWGLSPLDWRSHAIDERRDHPTGAFKAECGHRLMMVTTLHEAPPGTPCEACAAQQLARVVILCQDEQISGRPPVEANLPVQRSRRPAGPTPQPPGRFLPGRAGRR